MSGMNMGSSTSNAVGGSATGSASASKNASAMTPTVSFTLKTNIADGRLGFVGVGGDIEGKTNPTLKVKPGDVVQITLINGDGAEHDLAVPDFNVQSNKVLGKGASSVVVLQANKAGEFSYFCTVPGHRAAGMEGKIVVGEGAPQVVATGASVGRDPGDMPPAIGKRGPENVRIDLETVEVEGQLADGVTYTYWTFNGKVPGPFIRVREGDTVELHLKNSIKSVMTHSIDLHAVTGPGGGATVMQVPPGEEKSFTFKALNPGLYVYHCATAMVAHHIASGMYGMILVEPEGGLPPVDHEYYVMQGEIYTSQPVNQKGRQEFSVDKLLNERPEYVVFNGAVGSLTKDHPLTAKVGETVRIYFGVGGPNLTSSFHVIGEIFDRIYSMASLTAPPLTDVQTTTVAPGGATVVEFKVQVPGRYILVDHALSRLERGAAGYLVVDGPENHEIYTGVMSGDTGGH
ncbi:MAG: nitrite reductase, copper-containing [Chloroflexi bacterium]|nr:nitrite reductase, copper-containing [Chloroflexota bacterium]